MLTRAVALAISLTVAPALSAQDGGGREVVQPLPSAASQELQSALRQLARNATDLNALIAAGTASLELGDIDAAVGFFGRAEALAAGDPRVKAGKAAAYVRTRRPVEALELFQEAEAAGVEIVRLAGDYGLAYDLVGRNREAQIAYRRALGRGPSDEITRLLALSQAISGDSQGFENTLRPLLAKRDFAAYRTRAFGLAILDRADDAVAIAEAVMPRAMSRRLEPYLRYMPRLTKPQQAAAANLGVYPSAAQIGRDDPRIAALADPAPPSQPTRKSSPATADASLEPSGAPLGRTETRQAAAPSRAEAKRIARASRRESASDPLSRTSNRPRVVQKPAQPSATPAATPAQEPPIVPASTVAREAAPAQEAAPAPSAAELPSVTRSAPVVVARMEGAGPDGGFDLARATGSTAVSPAAPPSTPSATPPAVPSTSPAVTPASSAPSGSTAGAAIATSPASSAATPAESGEQGAVSLADAFADFAGLARPEAAPAAGAVDISAIEVPREAPPQPKPQPAKPQHPSRFWVQIATGRDPAALKFDWRRISRTAGDLLDGKGPFITAWGQTNRLLAGPYDNRNAARTALNSLTEKDIDAFTFTSPEGQEVEPLR